MLRLTCVTVSMLLAAAAVASAATPRDGNFRGPTSQEKEDGKPTLAAFTVTRQGRSIRSIRFPSIARCGEDTSLRVFPVVRRPVRLVVGSRVRLRGRLEGDLSRGSTYSAVFTMDGRFPTRRSARGTWGLRAAVRDRSGRITERCKTGTVRWRATRVP